MFASHPEVAALTDRQHQVGTKLALSQHQVQVLEMADEARSIVEFMDALGWKDRTKFRQRFVRPLLEAGLLAMTVPDKPRSSNQRYIITELGSQALQENQK